MTAEEIRYSWQEATMDDEHTIGVWVTFYLAEIAAQLAELNQRAEMSLVRHETR